jgi:hypothetical protein
MGFSPTSAVESSNKSKKPENKEYNEIKNLVLESFEKQKLDGLPPKEILQLLRKVESISRDKELLQLIDEAEKISDTAPADKPKKKAKK